LRTPEAHPCEKEGCYEQLKEVCYVDDKTGILYHSQSCGIEALSEASKNNGRPLLFSLYSKNTKQALALQDKELAKHYGIVGVNNDGKMIEFEEKPNEPKSTLASTGVYIYPPHVLPLLQEFVKKYENSDKAGNFLEWLHKKEHVYCYITSERWLDIGTLDQLEKAREEFKG